MKSFVLAIGTLAFLAQLAGCGADTPPAADGSDSPGEVQEYEKRRELERGKKIAPKATSPGMR